MLYISTRGGCSAVSSAEAILRGIAPGGGLFVPAEDVTFTQKDFLDLIDMTYQDRALHILKKFLTDFSTKSIEQCVQQAYATEKFDTTMIAPLTTVTDKLAVLELWHGPTCAFKDMALQLLPHLLVQSAKVMGDKYKYAILVATSGDTGKAALEGFKDVANTKILVFYPNEGVSEIQKYQMITQEGSNVGVVAIEGNFDDAQSGVKRVFTNGEFQEELAALGYKLSSANSINWGRLVPQIVYYISAYLDLVRFGKIKYGEEINFIVPTGNFGNILAGYYAQKMGLPIHKLICASNENNVLTDFIHTGIYNRNRHFYKTISPSMDILISSNLERLLYHLSGRNSSQVKQWMEDLQHNGLYKVDQDTMKRIKQLFWADFSTDPETLARIKDVFTKHKYVIDTHTAVAWDVYAKYYNQTKDQRMSVIVSTASPFKFNASVVKALFGLEALENKSEFDLLEFLAAKGNLPIPNGLKNLKQKEIKHSKVCIKEDMIEVVKDFLA
ncbi:threonine synthase [Bacillota bacterium LX-D]|nr:threonine synthase [Bacillota bacterium LX-D]